MNRILIALNAVLVAAVIFLFVKIYGKSSAAEAEAVPAKDSVVTPVKKVEPVKQVSSEPTGKIGYINYDRVSEECQEVKDLVTDAKRRKANIEASVESLRARYQQKVEEFQASRQAGIAPESELQAKAKEIQAIEQEAAGKEVLMDELSMDINNKNSDFQRTLREFLVRWNKGRYDYILTYSESVPTMLIGNTELEVTDEVIAQLNQEYKDKKAARKK